MKAKAIYFFVLFLSAFGGIIIRDYLLHVQVKTKVSLLYQPKEQSFSRRQDINLHLSKVGNISLEKFKVFKPVKVVVDSSGYIYVMDFSVPNVVKFSQGGIPVKVFGKGKGR